MGSNVGGLYKIASQFRLLNKSAWNSEELAIAVEQVIAGSSQLVKVVHVWGRSCPVLLAN